MYTRAYEHINSVIDPSLRAIRNNQLGSAFLLWSVIDPSLRAIRNYVVRLD